MTSGSQNDNSQFNADVNAAYFAVLGRAPSAQELAAGVASLSGGDSADTLQARLALSAEAQGVRVIRSLYEGLLGVSADAGGLAAWAGATAGGLSLADVAAGILNSPGFAARHPDLAANGDFVNMLYTTLLGRTTTPPTSETSAWVTLLTDGTQTRAQIAVAIATSAEAVAPNSALTQKTTADTSHDFTQAVVATQLTEAALGQTPQTKDLSSAVSQLEGGVSATALGQALSQTTDGQIVAKLRGVYESVLGRSADQQGLQAWHNAVAAGMSLDQAADEIARSGEYQSAPQHQNQSNQDFVTSLYQSMFGRNGDENGDTGAAAWVAALNAGTITRGDVVAGLLTSSEAQAATSKISQKVTQDTLAAVSPTLAATPIVTTTLAPQTASAGTVFSYSLPAGLFSEPTAGDSLTYSATLQGASLPGWLSFDPVGETLRGSPTDAATGLFDVVITAADQNGLTAATTLALSVMPVFHTPHVSSTFPPALATPAGMAWSYSLPGGLFSEDVPGDRLSYSATCNGTTLPGWLGIDAQTGTLSGTPPAAAGGLQNIVVTATDMGGLSASVPVALSVTPVAATAQVSAGVVPMQAGAAGTPWTFSLPAGLFSDAAVGETLTYSATLGGGALPGWLSFDPIHQSFSGMPTDAMTGLLDIVVTATDSHGNAAGTTLGLSVTPVFHTAQVWPGLLSLQAGAAGTPWIYSLPVGLFTEDIPGDTLTYSASLNGNALPGWLNIDPLSGTLSGLPNDTMTGLLDIVVTATDSAQKSASANVTLAVTPVFHTAQVSPGLLSLQAGAAGTPWTYSLPVGLFTEDIAGDTLTYGASLNGGALPGWLAIDSLTGTLSGLPTDAKTGLLDIVVTATDMGNNVASANVTLAVTPVFHTPVALASVTSLLTGTGSQWAYSLPNGGFSEDVPGDTLTYSASYNGGALPAWVSFDSTHQTFNGTPPTPATGVFDFVVTATDLDALSANTTVALSVSSTYQPPAASPGLLSLQAGSAGTPWIFSLPVGLFSEPDPTDTLTYSASLNGNPLPGWLNIDSLSGTLNGLPNDATTGLLDIVVTATDQHGNAAGADMTLSVTPVFHTAQVSPGLLSLQAGAAGTPWTYSLPVGLFTEDIPNDTLTYGASLNGGALPGWLAIDSLSGTLSGLPTDAKTGLLDIVVTATDMGNNVASANVTLSVTPVFHTPVALASVTPLLTGTRSQWAYSLPNGGFSEDVPGDTLTYSAHYNGGALPAWVSFDSTHQTFNGTPPTPATGVFDFVVTATDLDRLSANTTVALSVSSTYQPPAASPGLLTLQAGAAGTPWTYSLPVGLFSEVDPTDTLTYSASFNGNALPGWLSFDPIHQTFSGLPNDTMTGLLDIVVTATDHYANAVNAHVTLSVTPVFHTAQVSPGLLSLQAGAAGTPWIYSLPVGLFTEDIPGDTLTYSASLNGNALPGWLAVDPLSGTLSGLPNDVMTGLLDIVVTATDSAQKSASAHVTLSVTPVFHTAQVSPGLLSLQAGAAGTPWIYSLPVGLFTEDIAGDTLTYSASLNGNALPGWLNIDPLSGTLSGLPNDTMTGLLDIVVTATDSAQKSASANVTLAVTPVFHTAQVSPGLLSLQAGAAGTPWTYSLPVGLFTEDIAGDTLTYGASLNGGALPGWLAIDSLTGTLSGLPTDAKTGLLDIVVTATDMGNKVASANVTLSVTPVFHTPVALASVASLLTGTGSQWAYSLPNGGFSEDVPGDTLTYSASYNGGALPAWVSFDSTHQTFNGTPPTPATGVFDFVVTATDLDRLSANTTVALSVSSSYQPPAASPGLLSLQAGLAGTPWTYSLPAGLFSEVDPSDTLTYSASLNGNALPGWLSFDPIHQTFSGLPNDTMTGLLDIVVTATDHYANAVNAHVTLSVTPVFHTAQVSPGLLSLQAGAAGTPWIYSLPVGLFTEDIPGDSLTYSASFGGNPLPGWLSFDSIHQTFSGLPNDVMTGLLDIVVTATDSAQKSASAHVTLSVTPVFHTAQVSPGLLSLQAGAAGTPWLYSLPNGLFTEDIPGDSLTYGASLNGNALPGWLSFDSIHQTFSGLPNDVMTGLLDIVVTATDNEQESASAHVTLSVTPVFHTAQVSPGLLSLQAGAAGSSWLYSLPNGLFTEDIPGDTLTYSASLNGNALPGWLSFDSIHQTFSGMPTDARTGLLDIVVTATDGAQKSASAHVTLSVAPVFHTPQVSASQVQAMASAGAGWSFASVFSEDIPGDTLTYSEGGTLPAWLHLDTLSGMLSGTPRNADSGLLDIVVTATDLGKDAASMTLALSVAPTYQTPSVSTGLLSLQAKAAGTSWMYTLPVGLFSETDPTDTLTYSASLNGSTLPGWLSFDPGHQSFSGMPNDAMTGLLDIVVTATDQGNQSASAHVTLSVTPVFHTAHVSPGLLSTQAKAAGSSWVYSLPNGLFTEDIPGDSLTYGASLDGKALPGWLSFDSIGHTFSGMPTDARTGLLDIVVTATDMGNKVASANVTLSVTPVFHTPQVSASQVPATAFAGTAWSFASVFSEDIPGDTLTYSATHLGAALPAWMSFNSLTGMFSGTPQNADSGVDHIWVTATDLNHLSASMTLALSVLPTYHTPSVSTGLLSMQAGAAGSSWMYTLPSGLFSETDPTDTLTYGASLNGSALPGWLSFDPVHQSFSGMPTDALTGQLDIVVTATDQGNQSASATVTLAVTPVFHTAHVSAGLLTTQAKSAGSSWFYTLPSPLFTEDIPGDSLTYGASLDGNALPGWLSFDSIHHSFSGMPTDARTGLLDIVVTATDMGNKVASANVTLSVTPVFHTPHASASLVQAMASAGTGWSFASVFSEDIPGDTLTYTETVVGGTLPAWLHLDTLSGMLSGTPYNTDTALLDIVVTATDLGKKAASMTLALSVAAAYYTPLVSTGLLTTQAGVAGSSWMYTLPVGLFSEPDPTDTLTYSASLNGNALPDWLSFDSISQTFSGMPNDTLTGLLDIVVTATDQGNQSASATVTLAVTPVFHTAHVTPGLLSLQAGSAGASWGYSLPNGLFTEDIVGDSLTYGASLNGQALPGWLSFDSISQTFSGMPTDARTGLLDIVVTATDMGNNVASAHVTLSVTPVFHTPHASASQVAATAFAGAGWSFASVFSEDIPGDTLTYSATHLGAALPAWMSFNSLTGMFSGTPQNADSGVDHIWVTATDLNHLSASMTLALSIHPTYPPSVSTGLLSLQAKAAGSSWTYTLPSGLFSEKDPTDSLTYGASLDGNALPGWLSFDSMHQTFSGMPTDARTGLLDIVVTATDMGNNVASANVTLSVTPVFHTPHVSAGLLTTQAGSVGAPWFYTLNSGVFTEDVPGDTLTYGASLNGQALPAWLSFDSVAHTFTGTPPSTGLLDFVVTATDLGKLSASANVMLSVAPALQVVSGFTFQSTTLSGPTAAPVMTPGSDSGVFNNDGITNVTTPFMTGSGVPVGAQVLLYESTSLGGSFLGSATANAQGVYYVQPANPLSDGQHSLYVLEVVSGVTSAPSPSGNIYVDTTPMDVSSLSWIGALPVANSDAPLSLEFPDPLGTIVSLTASSGDQPLGIHIDPNDPKRLDFTWQTPGTGTTVNLNGTITDIAGNASSFNKPVTF